jgi:HEAT repeat protein
VSIDLSPWRAPAELVNAIWAARREERRDLQPAIVQLLDHDDPTVREEAVSLLFVKWADRSLRQRLISLMRSDPDFGVRARAAGALGLTSDDRSRRHDCEVLRQIVLDREDDPVVRKACYEALQAMIHGKAMLLDDDVDLDEDVDLEWVKAACSD